MPELTEEKSFNTGALIDPYDIGEKTHELK
jgi:hypothetical protein